jgi:hypothetical protein
MVEDDIMNLKMKQIYMETSFTLEWAGNDDPHLPLFLMQKRNWLSLVLIMFYIWFCMAKEDDSRICV